MEERPEVLLEKIIDLVLKEKQTHPNKNNEMTLRYLALAYTNYNEPRTDDGTRDA